ncbi:MAG: HAMP domain-containing sensor histidine kinase [Solirubrobacterales bacterium]
MSATLTAVILVGFAAVVGRLVSDRLEGDFGDDLQARATNLANSAANDLSAGRAIGSSSMSSMTTALSSDGLVRIVYADGSAPGSLPTGFGAPNPGTISHIGSYDVAAREVLGDNSLIESGSPTERLYLQYARPHAAVGDTIGRMYLFLGGGVLVGTLLAGLAGMAVANRAMRPIAALTATAGEIATTRDPSQRIPQPESDDEVAELARTLDQMLRELDAARTETDETIKRQREFVADASHELRTPLTSILANLELLDHALADGVDEDERAAVGSALRSSKRMNRLVGDLLLLARADAGRVGLQADCDLALIAREAYQEVSPVLAGHALSSDIESQVLVHGNPDELHRMILNLLENAIRHTPPGTGIRLDLERRGASAQLVVADDGPGLPRGMESQIFDRFVRGAGPADRTTRNGDGSGLGLSIVRAVVLAHGGEVSADSAGTGSRFVVDLPLAEV